MTQVVRWLGAMGLDQYSSSFQENAITGEDLYSYSAPTQGIEPRAFGRSVEAGGGDHGRGLVVAYANPRLMAGQYNWCLCMSDRGSTD